MDREWTTVLSSLVNKRGTERGTQSLRSESSFLGLKILLPCLNATGNNPVEEANVIGTGAGKLVEAVAGGGKRLCRV